MTAAKPKPKARTTAKTSTTGSNTETKVKPKPEDKPVEPEPFAEAAHHALDHRLDAIVDKTPLYAGLLREMAPSWCDSDSDETREHRSEALIDRLILAGGNR